MGSLEISVFLFGRNDSFGAIFKSFGLILVVFLKPTCVEYLFVGLVFSELIFSCAIFSQVSGNKGRDRNKLFWFSFLKS